jgi:Zn finger protein HypA/HybF involved in hydrogenase expression
VRLAWTTFRKLWERFTKRWEGVAWMLNTEEAQRYENTLSKQKLLKSPANCRKCKTVLNDITLVTDMRIANKFEWDFTLQKYILVEPEQEKYVLKSTHQCPNCGAKIKIKGGKE